MDQQKELEMTELKHYKKRVREILKEHENARNNDGTLTAYYIYKHLPGLVKTDEVGNPYIQLNDFKQLPSLENIRRSRQLIQNTDGDFPPTDSEVIKARKIKEKNWNDAEVREAKGPMNHKDD